MATFTSTQTGDWDDGASWGLNSPGVEGVDYPGLTGDVVIIAATHVITYNKGQHTLSFGNITINGTLTFPIAADSDLILGSAALMTIGATGSLIIGTSSNPIGAAYKAKLLFDYPGSSRVFFASVDGATLSFYGDPDYYGDLYKTTLKADWTSGQSFTVDGDASGWPVNSLITLCKGSTYSSYSTDSPRYTVASATYNGGSDDTTITINETAPGVTFYADVSGFANLVFSLSRNIFIGVEDFATPRIYLRPQQGSSNTNINYNNVQFQSVSGDGRSWNVATEVWNAIHDRCSFLNMTDCMDNYRNGEVNECVSHYANTIMDSSSNVKVTDFYNLASQYGMNCYATHIQDTNLVMFGAYYALNESLTNCRVTFVSCNRGTDWDFNGHVTAYKTSSVFYGGNINSGIYAKDCGTVFNSGCTGSAYGKIEGCTSFTSSGYYLRFTGEADELVVTSNLSYSQSCVVADNLLLDGTMRPYTMRSWAGDVDSVFSGDTGYQALPSTNDWGLLCTPYWAEEYAGSPFMLTTITNFSMMCAVGDSICSINVYPSGFATALTNFDLIAEVLYFDSTGGTTVMAFAPDETYPNGEWTSIDIPIVPGKDGFLFWNVRFICPDDGTILIDPVPIIT